MNLAISCLTQRPDRAALIRANWTPHKLQLQQRVNKHQLSNTNIVMNERLATFDGPEHLNVECEFHHAQIEKDVLMTRWLATFVHAENLDAEYMRHCMILLPLRNRFATSFRPTEAMQESDVLFCVHRCRKRTRLRVRTRARKRMHASTLTQPTHCTDYGMGTPLLRELGINRANQRLD